VIDEFFCARLTVPMDYGRPLNESADNPKVHIALMMLPGQGHAGLGNWSESPMLFNPGGPGGEGTALLLAAGRLLQAAVGVHHDVVGFDPRGIGATTPQADCFLPTNTPEVPDARARNAALLHRLTWTVGELENGLANTSDTAISKTAVRARAIGKLCQVKDGEDSILRFAGTPHVAQDMLSIVQAWDRWTSANKTSPSPRKRKDVVVTTESDMSEATPPSTRGKLVYWGFSYGTILGATFATMFRKSTHV
jgi:pimeloyl-ACP methyl ester carboxylesterase